jgi:hypothetical protein
MRLLGQLVSVFMRGIGEGIRWIDNHNGLMTAIATGVIALLTCSIVRISNQQLRLETVVETPVFDFTPKFLRSDLTVAMDFTNKGKTVAKEVQVTGSIARKEIGGGFLEGPYNLPTGNARLVPPDGHVVTRLLSLKSVPSDNEIIRAEATISYRTGLGEKETQNWCEILIPKRLGGGTEGLWIDCDDLHVISLHATISVGGTVSVSAVVTPPKPTPTSSPHNS